MTVRRRDVGPVMPSIVFAFPGFRGQRYVLLDQRVTPNSEGRPRTTPPRKIALQPATHLLFERSSREANLPLHVLLLLPQQGKNRETHLDAEQTAGGEIHSCNPLLSRRGIVQKVHTQLAHIVLELSVEWINRLTERSTLLATVSLRKLTAALKALPVRLVAPGHSACMRV